VELKDGKVIKVDVEGAVVPVIYMSSSMRTFNEMALYLGVRRGAVDGSPLSFMSKMLETYRLYNFTYMESLLARLPLLITDSIKAALESFDFEESITSIEADTEKCKFYAVLKDGSKKDITTYGKGHQAMLNMMIGVGA
jgi:hypothetical protein